MATKSLIHEARRNYWIIAVSNISKALTAKCVACRKPRKRPLDQLMGQIPSLRVAEGFPPFSNTAIDMFGPLHVKLNRKTVKEAEVVVFACMTTRPVHLELVNDKTADAFLMAFRRFASLRGHPRVCCLVGLWNKLCRYANLLKENYAEPGTFPSFRAFYARNSPVISNGHGTYLTQVIRMASWKLSSSLSDKVSMLPAGIKPLRRNNGEHFSQRQPTSSTDALCIQVLMTSGKLHPSHRTIFLMVNIFRHLN